MACDLRIKYDEALKRRAAELFADGHGYTSVAGLLDVPKRTVKGWLRIWRAGGTTGLTSMGKNYSKYSYETKLSAARAVVDEGMTRSEAMSKFGIMSEAPISRWVKAYREGGAEALRPKPKGRPPGSSAKPKELTREQELERRVQKLEAENAYLKKSIALKAEKRSRTARRPRP